MLEYSIQTALRREQETREHTRRLIGLTATHLLQAVERLRVLFYAVRENARMRAKLAKYRGFLVLGWLLRRVCNVSCDGDVKMPNEKS